MSLPVYLAMTAAEILHNEALPANLGWMACHFSAYGTGLSNLPRTLPKGSMLIVNDRTSVQGHDPQLICKQLAKVTEELSCSAVLLDLQRPENPETAAIAKAIVSALSCPVAVTEYYAKDLNCPVFLPPPPLNKSLDAYIAPWKGREIWLELALTGQVITVTESGSRSDTQLPAEPRENAFEDPALCCKYYTEVSETQIRFTLFRTPEDLSSLLQKAEALGITRAIGLYQELGTVMN